MKKNSMVATICAVLVMISLSCKDEERCSIHPEAFRFSLIGSENYNDLLAAGIYQSEDIAIYYYYKGERQDLIVNSDLNQEDGLQEMVSAQLPMISLTGRSNIFYLQLSPAETDTLHVSVAREIREDCDYHPYITVRHNSRNIPVVEGESFILYK